MRNPRNASSSAIGTVITAATVRNPSHAMRAGEDNEAKPAAMALGGLVPVMRSNPNQIPNTAQPAITENPPNRQSSSKYFDRKNQRTAATATKESTEGHR